MKKPLGNLVSRAVFLFGNTLYNTVLEKRLLLMLCFCSNLFLENIKGSSTVIHIYIYK